MADLDPFALDRLGSSAFDPTAYRTPTGVSLSRSEDVASASALTAPQLGLLGALRAYEGVGLGGTAVRLYNDVIQRGRRDPITERDFSPAEQEEMRRMVEAKSAQAGSPAGSIDYKDYRPGSALDSNALGGFRYLIDEMGNISVKDQYDFNRDRASSFGEESALLHGLGILANPRGVAATIGRKIAPDGSGVPVSVFLKRGG